VGGEPESISRRRKEKEGFVGRGGKARESREEHKNKLDEKKTIGGSYWGEIVFRKKVIGQKRGKARGGHSEGGKSCCGMFKRKKF